MDALDFFELRFDLDVVPRPSRGGDHGFRLRVAGVVARGGA